MKDLLLIITLLIWIPMIPLRLIIQGGIPFWRKIGDVSYFLFFVYWAGIDVMVLSYQDEVARTRIETSPLAMGIGAILAILALLSAFWTARTLGLTTLSTRPQVSPQKVAVPLIVEGPYQYLRHPFYFCEWFLLGGLALVTGSWIVGAILVATIVIDPVVTLFEEKELVARFGNDYVEYQKKVPRLLPTLAPFSSQGGS